MRRPFEVYTEACRHCGFCDVPTFREERRVAYRQVGEEGDHNYSRHLHLQQEVLVCLGCGDIHKVIGEVKV
jgi:hypothetical protein